MKTIVIALLFTLLLSAGATAQENDLWTCQGQLFQGFNWEGNSWNFARYDQRNYFLIIDNTDPSGSRLRITSQPDSPQLVMICEDWVRGMIKCDDPFGFFRIDLNPMTGLAVIVRNLGGLVSEDLNIKDSITQELIACVKVQ